MKHAFFAMILFGYFGCCLCHSAEPKALYPWRKIISLPKPGTELPLQEVMKMKWRDCGGQEGKITIRNEAGLDGNEVLDWQINIDHFNKADYPIGWPAFETLLDKPVNWTARKFLRFKVRAVNDAGSPQTVRFIMRSGKTDNIQVLLPKLIPGIWTPFDIQLPKWADRIDRIHFFISESDYKHGTKLHFQIGGFMLCEKAPEMLLLPKGHAGASLWVGERGDTSSQAVIQKQGTPMLPALLHIENKLPNAFPATSRIKVTFREIFSEKHRQLELPLPSPVPADACTKITFSIPTADLQPGYYHILADLVDGGSSLLGIRKGSDDLYISAPGETQTYTILSLRTALCLWCKDLLHDEFMHITPIALPHSFDPMDKSPESYSAFIDAFAARTGNHAEGLEAGATGLALAAEAFRKTKDLPRQKFAEKLLLSMANGMLTMQEENGAVIHWSNKLGDMGIGESGRTGPAGQYISNQIGEWMRGLNYISLYFSQDPAYMEFSKKLNNACRKAGDFLVKHGVFQVDGLKNVIRDGRLSVNPDNNISFRLFHQEGRQCDVYQPRALAGLSYTAYTLLRCGETVPESWWPVFEDSTQWMTRKMKPNGWFDWQCEDVVEGGCHTFLGNIYAGEALFGCFTAAKLANRQKLTEDAKNAALKAYHYVTDYCYIKGKKYEYPLEFWVGPYVYWLFTEWEAAAGTEPTFHKWLNVLDTKWSVERNWQDFVRNPKSYCGRNHTGGVLHMSILGYLGIKQMTEINQPLQW